MIVLHSNAILIFARIVSKLLYLGIFTGDTHTHNTTGGTAASDISARHTEHNRSAAGGAVSDR